MASDDTGKSNVIRTEDSPYRAEDFEYDVQSFLPTQCSPGPSDGGIGQVVETSSGQVTWSCYRWIIPFKIYSVIYQLTYVTRTSMPSTVHIPGDAGHEHACQNVDRNSDTKGFKEPPTRWLAMFDMMRLHSGKVFWGWYIWGRTLRRIIGTWPLLVQLLLWLQRRLGRWFCDDHGWKDQYVLLMVWPDDDLYGLRAAVSIVEVTCYGPNFENSKTKDS